MVDGSVPGFPGAGLDLGRTEVSAEEVHAARRTVCARALDAEDARELLLALGLIPTRPGDLRRTEDTPAVARPRSATDSHQVS